jgi:GYF domain 2
MERQWYQSRDGKVFGPVTDTQLAQAVAAGRVLPTDMMNLAGQPNWWPANAIPGLLPQQPQQEILSLDPDPEPVRVMRVTCFACFREVSVEIPPGVSTVHCPRCRAAIETGEPTGDAQPSGNQAAFAKLESKREFKERMQQKAAAAQGANSDGAAIGGIIGGIIGGMG